MPVQCTHMYVHDIICVSVSVFCGRLLAVSYFFTQALSSIQTVHTCKGIPSRILLLCSLFLLLAEESHGCSLSGHLAYMIMVGSAVDEVASLKAIQTTILDFFSKPTILWFLLIATTVSQVKQFQKLVRPSNYCTLPS